MPSLSRHNDIRFLFCPTQIGFHGKTLQGYKHWFGPAVLEAGMRNFTWYCLRHTFAGRLAMAGVDIRTIAELMGHKKIQMTMRYSHLAPHIIWPRSNNWLGRKKKQLAP